MSLNDSNEDFSLSTSPEARMWQSVIWQAVRESYMFDKNGAYLKAIQWLVDGGEDARKVFEYAGLDHEYVAPRFKTLIVLMARSIARGRQPSWDAKNKRVVFRRPAEEKRETAKWFLKSCPLGVSLWGQVSLPDSDFERDKMIASAIALSKDSPSEYAED